jgi:hypothetical protein
MWDNMKMDLREISVHMRTASGYAEVIEVACCVHIIDYWVP